MHYPSRARLQKGKTPLARAPDSGPRTVKGGAMSHVRLTRQDIEMTIDRRIRSLAMDTHGTHVLDALRDEAAGLARALNLRLDAKERGQR